MSGTCISQAFGRCQNELSLFSWSLSRAPSENISPRRLEARPEVDLPTYTHKAFLEIGFVGVVSHLVVHNVLTKHE